VNRPVAGASETCRAKGGNKRIEGKNLIPPRWGGTQRGPAKFTGDTILFTVQLPLAGFKETSNSPKSIRGREIKSVRSPRRSASMIC